MTGFRHDIGEYSLPARFARARQLIDQGAAQGLSLFNMSGLYQSIFSMTRGFTKNDKEFEDAYKPYAKKAEKGGPLTEQDMWDVVTLIESSAARTHFWTYPDDEESEMTIPEWKGPGSQTVGQPQGQPSS